MPQFEYDLLKSLSNWWKHGITLAEAEKLWLDPGRVYQPAKFQAIESRHAIIAHYEGKIWTGIFALRSGKIRLVSARVAKKRERQAYHR